MHIYQPSSVLIYLEAGASAGPTALARISRGANYISPSLPSVCSAPSFTTQSTECPMDVRQQPPPARDITISVLLHHKSAISDKCPVLALLVAAADRHTPPYYTRHTNSP